jgi:hypothetical protein
MQNLFTASVFTGNTELSMPCDALLRDHINNWFIPQYQYKYLVNLLGYTLYLEFENALSGTPTQEWIDLRDGKTYQDYSDAGDLHYVKFDGVTEMLKYFVYFHIIKEIYGKDSFPAKNIQRNENANRENIYNIAIEKYNVAIDKYGLRYNIENKSQFSSSYFNHGYPSYFIEKDNVKLIPSAYNFIRRSNELITDTYQNWIFTDLQYMNLLTF